MVERRSNTCYGSIPFPPVFRPVMPPFFGMDDSWHDQGQKIPYRPFAARRIPQGGRTGCLPKQVVRQPRRSSAWSTDARTQGKIWAQLFFFHLPEELPVSRSAAPMHGCGDAGSVPRYLRPLPVVARCCPLLPERCPRCPNRSPPPPPVSCDMVQVHIVGRGVGRGVGARDRPPRHRGRPRHIETLGGKILRLGSPKAKALGAAKTLLHGRPRHEASWAAKRTTRGGRPRGVADGQRYDGFMAGGVVGHSCRPTLSLHRVFLSMTRIA